jgi:NitT/TauT family transport system ATP-binding protein
MANLGPPPKIELRNVTKSFQDLKRGRETVAVEKFSLAVQDGEFLCLLGPSGCGKSTILNLVAGFEHPTKGEVLLDGEPILRPGPDRGVVFQEPMLFPWLTVLDNITFGPRMNGGRPEAYLSAAARYITLMGLSGFERHRPYELSGGMKQRVAIARAWITDPKVLLLDEPFGALDAQTRLMMQELLVRVWEQARTTVVFVTHDVEEAIFLADRVCLMTARPGQLKEDLRIPFDRPRNYEDLVPDKRYVELKRQVFHSIREETIKFMTQDSGAGPA